MHVPSELRSVFARLRARNFFRTAGTGTLVTEPALRDELFNEEQMASHGVKLASRHSLRRNTGKNDLLTRLDDNERVLQECCKLFSTVNTLSKNNPHLTPAGEWLLDNYWMIEEQIHTARKHLPRGYSRELPELADGPSAGLPRVYDIALESISHGDGRLEEGMLRQFVQAYQSVSPLTLGELWAVPIMLRLALIENLRRVSTRVMADWQDQGLAARWADTLIEKADTDRKNIVLAVADMAASKPPMTGAFVAEFSRRLQGQSTALSLPLNWIEELLGESGSSVDRLIQQDTQQQAANQVSISNSIGSLRLLSSLDWQEFVEDLSVVEQTLRRDPAGVYPRMDFASRDAYRHAVETLAKKCRRKELKVAQAAVELSSGQAEVAADPDVRRHVGFYLIDDGLPALKRYLANRDRHGAFSSDTGRQRHERVCLSCYLGAILLISLGMACPFLLWLQTGQAAMLLLAPVILLAASQPGIKVVNWLVTLIYKPHVLPRMDYGKGIPASARTMVVIPSLIGDEEDVDDLLDKVEVHYLANRGGHIQFGLLTDFKEADREVMDQDDDLVERLCRGIETLNRAYAPAGDVEPFFVCHRPRRWYPGEGTWFGRERKRGKLDEFNDLLRGGGHEAFTRIVGNSLEDASLSEIPVRYVITLDTDTLLPRDAARKLAGSMAHPLNVPVYDERKGRVTSGYAIMQPRVSVTLPSSNRSLYARLFSDTAGLDPYTRSVSDVYEDLFHHGSYVGKGIYDVTMFRRALRGRFPENRVLSHDLIEGSYARSGMVTDVMLFEDYPSGYNADVKRRHRWIRGDWQIALWLLPRVPSPDGGLVPNTLSGLSRWKLFDNLRRSLVPPCALIMLLAGWFISDRPVAWTVLFLVLALLLPITALLQALVRKPQDVAWNQHLRVAVRGFGRDCLELALNIAWLPHEAWYHVDAIVRTVWRMAVSKRHLLQWNPSSDTERYSTNTLDGLYREMAMAPAVGAAVLAGVLAGAGSPAALPFGLAWLLSPALAWRLSLKRMRRFFLPDARQARFLRTMSRRTWAFFETHVSEENNWLPPDNLQERPGPVVARRTSPTNMGLSLLAHLAARDFAYLSTGGLLDRLEQSLEVMSRLKRYRNHFFNWYDTTTLDTLAPEYVSTVDSGNLAGHLLVLRQGLVELADEPVVNPRLFQGLMDTAMVLESTLCGRKGLAWTAFSGNLAKAAEQPLPSLDETLAWLRTLRGEAAAARAEWAYGGETDFWFALLERQCQGWITELEGYSLPEVAAGIGDGGSGLSLRQLQAYGGQAGHKAGHTLDRLEALAARAASMAGMDFRFLYDDQRELFSIGYSVTEQRLDASYYDLLASEARLTYYVAIAQGQIPQESWFALGRLLTDCNRIPVLLSWSGSMFEYLMPDLVMPSYEGSLLDTSCEGAVRCQIAYARDLNRPWGISESGYYMQDAHLNYQYKAFGVPSLGLKRGLADETVMAPYASAMALMVLPDEACRNLQQLAGMGLAGQFGLYEAVDFTAVRLPRGKDHEIVCSYMAHHQGMALLALAAVLLGWRMQRRFMAEPCFQAGKLLLEERMPKSPPEYLNSSAALTEQIVHHNTQTAEARLRVFKDPDSPVPGVQLLSNGRYHVMVSSSGAGYSRFENMALSRWREDATRDNWGMFCYLRDADDGHFWSTTYQPVCRQTETFEAIFSEARAEFRVRERDIDVHTEIVVFPEDNCELRRMHIVNRGRRTRTVELTSYAEVDLSPLMADNQHPAFSKLFVQTELVPELQAILCNRRPSSATARRLYLFHLLAAHGVDLEAISYETDRNRFIGRGRNPADPAAMDQGGLLSGTAGPVLDPIMAIRARMRLEPGQPVTIDLVTGVSPVRDGASDLMHKFRDKRLADRIIDLAWTHSQVLLHQFNATLYEAHLYEHMAASVIYANASMRTEPEIMKAVSRGQSGLWGQGISGDNPVVLLKIRDSANIELVSQMVKAHAYWKLKGLVVDLVIWNEDSISYRQNLHDLILSIIPSGMEGHVIDRPGGIFVRAAQQMSREDRVLIQTVARLILSDAGGALAEQIYRRRFERKLPGLCPVREPGQALADAVPAEPENARDFLILANPLGGFTPDGREYVIRLGPGQTTPAPWVNVLANEQLGTVISESGSAYTWRENAHEYRLTPWLNDPVTDACGEAIYVRDETTGHFWSPTPLPRCPLPAPGWKREGYTVRHGFGYSLFEHLEAGIATELTVFVARTAPVRFSVLRVRNASGETRRLSATGYVEWVLGDLRSKHAMYVQTEIDPDSGVMLARNPYSMDFPDRVAFFRVDGTERTCTGDRTEFLGRNGNLSEPLAMRRFCLSGRAGAGFDPCAAMQTAFTLQAGESREMVFILGAGRTMAEARDWARQFGTVQAARQELASVRAYWNEVLDTVQVQTPDPAVNVMVNGWLPYQTVACRFLARSGFYQSGGAYGFRDQLQDSMAMVYAWPDMVREHLLRSASRQFIEGDVQHWWHPPLNRGVRTRCSDDYLWLPVVAERYLRVTQDSAVLDEPVGYIEGRPLNPEEESVYDLPAESGLTETLYDHCVRSIRHGFRYGAHGLPLMGSGDWNDGMDRVGIHGKGESVWLGFFLYFVLLRFAPVAEARGDAAFAEQCRIEADKLRRQLERHGWDGAWYRRAYFDDGTPLGSSSNEECRIDSIAQSWSVLSGAGGERKRRAAMDALEANLVRRDIGIIQLFTPPFDKSPLDPGYIKGYVPGVRENGGQYTHAAVWAAMAYAELGDCERAWEMASLINPVRHADNAERMGRYMVEPYVLAADVYAVSMHEGRGGWTWYTGAAGWMYRLYLESLLGLRVEDGVLRLKPLLPKEWESIGLRLRWRGSLYVITIRRDPAGRGLRLVLDGTEQPDADGLRLADDGVEHQVELVLGGRRAARRKKAEPDQPGEAT